MGLSDPAQSRFKARQDELRYKRQEFGGKATQEALDCGLIQPGDENKVIPGLSGLSRLSRLSGLSGLLVKRDILNLCPYITYMNLYMIILMTLMTPLYVCMYMLIASRRELESAVTVGRRGNSRTQVNRAIRAIRVIKVIRITIRYDEEILALRAA